MGTEGQRRAAGTDGALKNHAATLFVWALHVACFLGLMSLYLRDGYTKRNRPLCTGCPRVVVDNRSVQGVVQIPVSQPAPLRLKTMAHHLKNNINYLNSTNMALISCTECTQQISDRATTCPHCGFPLELLTQPEQEQACPDFPSDLSLGKQIANWKGDAAFSGEFSKSQGFLADISSGKVSVAMFTNGLMITRSLFSPALSIHRSQIISLEHTSQEEVHRVGKSVVGRAIIGGVLTGGIGAIVGGLSGIGSKEKKTDVHYLVVNFWDVKARIPQTALISGNKVQIKAFVERYNKNT